MEKNCNDITLLQKRAFISRNQGDSSYLLGEKDNERNIGLQMIGNKP